MVGLAVAFSVAAVAIALDLLMSPWARDYAFANGDLQGYLEGTRRFLASGSPYVGEQTSGPWQISTHSFIHPPSALPLFLPFLVLPAVLWWLIPVVGTVALIAYWRPAEWTWPLIALCLAWPRSAGSLFAGNSDLWAAFFVAVSLHVRPVALALLVKPTFLPLALLGVKDRTFWATAAVLVGLLAISAPLWVSYASVVTNAHLPITYSLLNLPLIVMPLIAWLGRRETRDAGWPAVVARFGRPRIG
jgi:hypothetical protein